MPYRVSFVVDTREQAEAFVDDAQCLGEYEGNYTGQIIWMDDHGTEHCLDVREVKFGEEA
jgi:hypothetical protein